MIAHLAGWWLAGGMIVGLVVGVIVVLVRAALADVLEQFTDARRMRKYRPEVPGE